jgi:2-methylfumaryl-CoA isomerase
MVVAISDRQWKALVRAIGIESQLTAAAVALGHTLDTEDGRWQARELISAVFRPWFAARTLEDVTKAFTDRSLLWGPYRDFQQMLTEDPRVSEANPMFKRIDHPGYGRFLTTGSPLSFSRSTRTPISPASIIGADTVQVMHDVLQADETRTASLQADGVLGGKQPST